MEKAEVMTSPIKIDTQKTLRQSLSTNHFGFFPTPHFSLLLFYASRLTIFFLFGSAYAWIEIPKRFLSSGFDYGRR